MNTRARQQKLWENAIDLYAAASAASAEAWARARMEIEQLERSREELCCRLDEVKSFCRKSEQIRRQLIKENTELREEIIRLKGELQDRDNIIDRIAATHNDVLIAELAEGEGA